MASLLSGNQTQHKDPMFDLAGRVAVVTGAGSGLGSWIAEALVHRGAKVYIIGRREEPLKEITERINKINRDMAHYCVGDITVKSEIQKFVDFVGQHEKQVDLLVNNAGIFIVDEPSKTENVLSDLQPAPETLVQDWAANFGIHAWAPFMVTICFMPLLAKAGEGNGMKEGRGSVVMISSNASRIWNPLVSWSMPAYCASKAGLEIVSKLLATKLYHHNIRVNTIACGSFPTNDPASLAEKNIPMGRAGAASDLIGPLVFLATSASSYMTGQCMDLDGGVGLIANGTTYAGADFV